MSGECDDCEYQLRALDDAPCSSCDNMGSNFVPIKKRHKVAFIDTVDNGKIKAESAPDLLKKAANIMEERGKDYDAEGGERSMGKTIAAFNCITGKFITESEGWLLLQLLKDVRQWSNKPYHSDSAEDCIAYSALKAEALSKGV